MKFREPPKEANKLITKKKKKKLLKIKFNLKGSGSTEEEKKKSLEGKGSTGKVWNEGAQGAGTNRQTKRRAGGGPGKKTLVHLMRGVIKGRRRTKADGIKGDGSKTKIVHSQVISCIRVM